MDNIVEIKELFGSVSENEKAKFNVKPLDIKRAISKMAEAYKPDSNWENYPECHTAEYDDAAHRCAYLHKYAMMHTGLVYDIMQDALYIKSVRDIFQYKSLTLCSLGSGPGTDILALLFLLMDYMPKQCTAYLIDKSIGWSSVFDSIIKELRAKNYSNSKIASTSFFNYHYLKADLLVSVPVNVHNSVKNADIVTMIKFVSAAACKKTRPMIQNIFNAMNPGAIFLYIDNAGGGFYEMVEKTAKLAGMTLVFGPYKHHDYEEKRFMTVQNGSTSQYKTKVTAAIWKKSEGYPQTCYIEMDSQSSTRLHAVSKTENAENGDSEVIFQCAIEPVVKLESRYSFDEIDHSSSDVIKLHTDIVEEEQSGSCCLIM